MGHLKLKVVKATKIKNTDFLSKTDPYIVFYSEGKKYTTKVVNNNLNPVWNQEYELTLAEPTSSAITFLLYDSDTMLTSNELIASTTLLTNTLRHGETKTVELKWSPPENAESLFLEATATDFHGISGEVEKLLQQNEKHKQLNDELKKTTSELKSEVEKLHEENVEHKQLNNELKSTSTELKEEVIKFDSKVKILADEIHNLQKTKEALDVAVANFEQKNSKLSEEIKKLSTVEAGLKHFAEKQGADFANFVDKLSSGIKETRALLNQYAAENEKIKQNRRKTEIDSMVALSNNFQMLDGKAGLSIEEFQSYLDMLGPQFESRIKAKAPQQSLQLLFNSLDHDKNGTLNIPELRLFLEFNFN